MVLVLEKDLLLKNK